MSTYREWALQTIPVLVRWAQGAWDIPHYYSDLAQAVGFGSHRMSGMVLGEVNNILNKLKKDYNTEIPTLNALVQNQTTKLPGIGFNVVKKGYEKLSAEEKVILTRLYNEKAHQYDWDWVLKALKLKPARILDNEQLQQKELIQTGFGGGEGEEHKKLKEYIYNHPEILKIKKVKKRKIEYDLHSGDRLDVYFETNKCRYAIEVKPSTSPDSDILRGIFQCIKYKAVMDAERVLLNKNYDSKAILVVVAPISPENRQLALDLKVKVEEHRELLNKIRLG